MDAINYASKAVNANMDGGRATVNAEEELSVNIAGGSVLNYTGTPLFKIGKVMKSTLAPSGTTK